MKRFVAIILSALAVVTLVTGYLIFQHFRSPLTRSQRVLAWLKDPATHQNWAVKANEHCGNSLFLIPTDGFIGYLWGDQFNISHKHQGIDIFAGTSPGETAIYSVYDGYLTRQSDWKSSVIIRIPDDPLTPGRQIWVYYTHMADEDGLPFISDAFPPGTIDVFIPAGTLLGYQGNYSGNPGNPTGVHLHLSIVLSDATGLYKNETNITNTLDPSPYFGLPLNSQENPEVIPTCLGG
jgi:murein DD-endopeptidase MepM/ murein hydrolase activator NlpD